MNWSELIQQLEAGTVRAATQDEHGQLHANVEVKTPYAIKKIKAYANLPFISVTATKKNEKRIAARKIANSLTRSAGRFAQGFCGFT